jgi:aryl-alcohol dehydrogenase-like predicted oxidoreductase
MRARALGALTVSAVGLGCNQFGRKIDAATSTRVVHAALAEGITFLDTADRYGYGDREFSGYGQSETFLGRALRGRRAEAVVATKFGLALADDAAPPGAGRAYVAQACEASLRRLGTDYIDLYLLHRPDPATPVQETLVALDRLVEQGKVREIGWCNVTPGEISRADDIARAARHRRFACVQNEYSLLHRDVEHGVLPTCIAREVSFIPYFPLAGGLLTGKYRSGAPVPPGSRLATSAPNRPHLGLSPENLRTVDALAEFATSTGRSLGELALAWLLARPMVSSVIAGATDPDQVRMNAAAGARPLGDEELAQVDGILAGDATPTGGD